MGIDSCYEGLVKKLTEENRILEVSKKFLSLDVNHESVFFVYDLCNQYKRFPKTLEVCKSDKVSIHYRNLGNQHFKITNSSSKDSLKVEKYQAWQYYNLSLLYAPLNSENYALALSNRSAVFYALEKYDECIKDIDMVFSLKYPDHLKAKLTKRKEECRELFCEVHGNEQEEKIQEILSLKGPTNEKYVCASSKLEVVHSEEMGRHVIAKEDINVGEILACEEPYFVLLLNIQFLFFCNYCLSTNMNLMPCETCCYVLYCSKECKQKAWTEYHNVECSLMASLLHGQFTKLELLALRATIRARTDHADWTSLFKTIRDAEDNKKTEYHGMVKNNGKWIFDSKYYTSIHTLETNAEKRNVSDIFQKSITAAAFVRYLTEKTNFLSINNGEDIEEVRKCVADLLLEHLMTGPTNMHDLSSNVQNEEGNYVEALSIASAPYAFHSLVNHSCAPNVTRVSKLGSSKMIMYALRPIKKGMQIFDNYGMLHAIQSRGERQQYLKNQYKFDCSCEACVNDWPTYFNLKPAISMPAAAKTMKCSLLSTKNIDKLQNGDVNTALQLFIPLCKMAALLEPYAPCLELADCQETLKQCLAICEGVLPYGYSKTVTWNAIPPC